jgi:hypothetical protein
MKFEKAMQAMLATANKNWEKEQVALLSIAANHCPLTLTRSSVAV